MKITPRVGDLVRFKVGCEAFVGILLSGVYRVDGEIRPGFVQIRAIDATYGCPPENVEVVFSPHADSTWLKACDIERALESGWSLTTTARITCVLLGIEQTRSNVVQILRSVQAAGLVDVDQIEHEVAVINARLHADGSEKDGSERR